MFLVVFAAFFAARVFSSRRQRPGGQRSAPWNGSSLHDASQRSDVDVERTGTVPFTGIAAGWLIDPSGRHEQRYWSGTEWTEHVRDNGVPGTDPAPGSGSQRDS